MASFNAQIQLINLEVLFRGTVNEAPVYPREAVKVALSNNANSVMFAHNHPGMSLKASLADIEATKSLKNAMNTVSIRVLDHIIVAGDSFLSFSEQGLLSA